MNGSYEEFRDALRAFESGWDRERYENGVIADWQLDQWAGGSVQTYFPEYASWGDLTDAEWDAMSYRSMNSLGFVGYQFGEALLIDLGYYQDDVYYGNGAATNTWDGTWTGKNGVTSLEEFMTAEAQERAIQEAFGYNLQVIETGLGYGGESLDDYLGTTRTYLDNGTEVTVELTLTGIMAAAHLRGAWGTLSLLQGGNVSTDEYGTSILRYIDQFGGYAAPSIEDAIAVYTDGILPDDTTDPDPVDPDPVDPTPASGDDFANASITAQTATVAIEWQWGRADIIDGFDPSTDTIHIAWIGADSLQISEGAGGVSFAVPSNNQTVTLAGVSLSDLSPQRINALDATTRDALADLIAGDGDSGDGGMGDGGHGDDGHGDDGHGDDGHDHQMIDLTLTSMSRTIDDFDPATDMVHIGAGISAGRFEMFEESGDALGTTVRFQITDADGALLSTLILTGVSLDQLTLGNFSAADQTVANEIASVIGATIQDGPSTGGYELTYDSDGSNPAESLGSTDAGGTIWRANSGADDIVGFDPAVDQFCVGNTSVHGMILTKSQAGEIVVDSPWSDAAQIAQGVTYQDITIDTLGVVGNEHFRQDIGGVLSWEQGVGPREADTIYVRSHEYGVAEVVDGFDPSSMKLSFLYFGTRERLSVQDSEDGLVISSLPTGQSLTLTGVSLSDLVPGRVEFHHDQVIEDNLEVPFGFAQDDVTLVSRAGLLTPEAPAGQSTDGLQERPGDFGDGSTGDGGSDGDSSGDDGTGDGSDGATPNPDGVVQLGAGADRVEIFWNWGAKTTIAGFDPSEDVLDFRSMTSDSIAVTESEGDLLIEVLGNGGNITRLEGVQAEDLSLSNLTADSWNTITDEDQALILSMIDLGFDLG